MTTIVGFEGSLVPRAAGILPLVAAAGDHFELIRCKPELERAALDRVEFERLVEQGLAKKLERPLETPLEAPVLLYLPVRVLFAGRRFPPWEMWIEEYLHSPGIAVAFYEHGSRGLILSMTRAHDLLRLLLEELLGLLRLDIHGRRRGTDPESRLFLRSASAVLSDPLLRERVFALLFAQAAEDETKWNALLRDARREFDDAALERIKRDAAALQQPSELSASAG